MFERYTEQSRRVIFFARYEASHYGAPMIGPEHVLLALAREDTPLVKRLLDLDRPLDQWRRRLEALAGVREGLHSSDALPLAPETKRALAFAHEESDRFGRYHHIGTEHLLVGLLRAGESLATQILAESGLTLEDARRQLFGEVGETATPDESARAIQYPPAASNMLDPLLFSMTSARIEHIGIATPNIDDALGFWRDALGLEVRHTEVVEEQGVRVAMLPAGEARIELLEPTGDSSPVAKFLAKRGPGIHHVAVRVPDIRAALARLKDAGARLIDAEPRVGAGGCLVAFVHPQTAGGVLLELVEHTRPAHDPKQKGSRFELQ